MENKPLLSICIPTYNREKYLSECLDSIINQEGFNENDIEIIISDNASIDNTHNVIKQYQKKYNNIKYYKNDINLGMVKNVTKIIDYAKGKYSWIISDDDYLIENKLNNIIKLLKKTSINIFVLNYSNYNNSLDKITLENVMQIDNDIDLTNKNDFIKYITGNWEKIIGGLFFFVSNKIFLTKLFNDNKIKNEIINSNIEKEYKYAFPFSMILLNELINNGCYIFSDKYIKLRTGNLSWNYNDLIIYQYYFYKYYYKNCNNKLFKKFLKKYIIKKLLFRYYLIIITKKLGIYKILSKIWIKYFLKR